MKYLAIFLIFALSFFRCQDDIQTSSPTLQGIQHGDFLWKATSRSATVDSTGGLTISGTDGFGTMTIVLPTASAGTFTLGKGKVPTITFSQENTTYSTQNDGVEYPVYLSDGSVSIEEVNAETKTMKGTFYFNSYDSTGTKYMNFSEGVFYNLSYITEE
jgi:hypothetical protein